jgi:hypothetical protein
LDGAALDGGENDIGGPGPTEALWIGVDGVDVGAGRRLQFGGWAAGELPFGDVGDLDLI